MQPDKVRDLSVRLDLPDLVGTYREIQQAKFIRYKKLEQVPFFEEKWELFLDEIEKRKLPVESLSYLRKSDLAKFWIDNQDLDFWELLEFFM